MPEVSPSRYRVDCTWDDVPHLDEKTKTELLASYPPHMREARSAGVPSLGAGAIYPVALSEIEIEPFPIPDFWPKFYAMDVGWKRTAALWFAYDRPSDVLYAYSEHYQGEKVPALHAKAIKARGEWIRGVIDPASNGRGQIDGKRLFKIYKDEGLELKKAKNEVEAGIYMVWQRLESGRLKVFNTLVNFKSEYRYYRRNEKGAVVKENDHLMDCARYGVVSGIDVATQKPSHMDISIPPSLAGDSKAGW